MVNALEYMKAPAWSAHAAAAGLKNPPSELTVAEVLAVYQARAKLDPEAVAALEGEDPFARVSA